MTDLKMAAKRVAELEGAQLDWAVAVADGLTPEQHYLGGGGWIVLVDSFVFDPSKDWRSCGPILVRHNVSIICDTCGAWSSPYWYPGGCKSHAFGFTPLIAAMRAFVASKLGDVVEVPDA